MLGVDLIYFNESVGNIVMLQYKMLEPERAADLGGTDWIYRPDAQLESELSRMRLPPIDEECDDYRLHPNPFFFKFVRRKGDGDTHTSSIISLDHCIGYSPRRATAAPEGEFGLASTDSKESI